MQVLEKLFKQKIFTWAVSIVTILICIVSITSNIISQQQEINNKSIESFKNTVISMKSVVTTHLYSQQKRCDSWAKYINDNPMTVEEALTYIDVVTTVDTSSAQILDPETFQGFAAHPMTDPIVGHEAVSYSESYPQSLKQSILDILASPSTINVTGMFTNPINGQQVMAFVSGITVLDEDGNEKQMALLRVMPASQFDNLWVLPSSYENAHIELLDRDGNYITNSSLIGQSNFYTYIGFYNELTAQEIADYRQRVNSDEASVDFFRIADGSNTLFVSSEVISISERWVLIGFIPLDNIQSDVLNLEPLILLAVAFLILFIVNVGHLNETNKQLKAAIAAEKKASSAKTEFLATMSHDIRTPMNAIIGMTAIADKNINDPHHVRECLRKIALSSNHLLTLINDILDISKIESGQYSINPIVFSLSDLMDNIFNVVRPNVRSKQLSLEIHAHHIEQEYLYADQLRLSQIYINILSNAVKYTNPGGKIVVDLYEEPSPLLTGGVRLTYRVADTGIGMRKEFMERMYDTFSRENDGRVDTIQGTGLGLAITKQLVDLMHGTIEAESELGVGSTFTVTLDLAAAEHMTDNIMLPNIRLIVIDDDPILLESAKETLLQIGIDADLANSGATGLQMVLNGHRVARDYRVVILDWSIPDMSGLEVTRRIRAELGADIPIIIVSAYDYSEIEQQALDAGANGFISKPLFKSTLFKTLCELLNIDEQKHDEESKKYSIEGMRILVAEDNDLNYEIAEYLLEDEGAQCTRAENGQVCVDLLQKDPAGFDLVLMDMQMPVMKGLEATQIIRSASDPLMQTIPIIAMTADAFAENVEECLNAGMDGHIAKPIEMTRVLAEIEKVMRSRGRSS